MTAYLTAANVDLAAVGNWQRQGDKRAKKPEPVLRPGQKKKRGKSLTHAALAQNRAVDG